MPSHRMVAAVAMLSLSAVVLFPEGGAAASPRGLAPGLAAIPASYLTWYREAARTCRGLSWTVLAGIGTMESNNGRSRARGVHNGKNRKGAEGPMQFEPATFAEYAVRADPSAPLTPYDPKDAIFTAARMLCADGAWSASRPGLERAIFAYNHACWYVRDVLAIASRYATAAHAGHHFRRHPPRRHGRHRRQVRHRRPPPRRHRSHVRQVRHRRPPPRRHRSHVRSRPDPSAHALCAGSGQYPAPGE